MIDETNRAPSDVLDFGVAVNEVSFLGGGARSADESRRGGGDRSAGNAPSAGDPPASDESPKVAGWRDAIPAEHRKMADRFASPADAVKSAFDLRQTLSRSITKPKPDADQAEWDEFYTKLGRPESPDGYHIDRPDNLPAELAPDELGEMREKDFLGAMHAVGATPDVVQAAIDWYYNEAADTHAEQTKEIGATVAEAADGLRREWGSDFDKNSELARRAYNTFGDNDFQKIASDYQLENNAAFIRAFARIGRQLGEDDMINGSTDKNANADLEIEAQKLLASDDYWTNEATQRRMRVIMDTIHGDTPINPSDR